MNKSELIKVLADACSFPAEESTLVVNVFFDSMKQALAENSRVEIRGLGSFKLKNYEGYVGRNPKTGKSVTVEPKKLPFFRAGKELKEFLNE
jgi:integration host factor subunit beta